MLDIVILVALATIIVYGGIALRVWSKKVGFDIHSNVRYEINESISEAIAYVEEIAAHAKKEGLDVLSSIAKMDECMAYAHELLPDIKLEDLRKKILASLGEGRRWAADKIDTVSDKVRG